MLLCEVGFISVQHVFCRQTQDNVVTDYLSYFFRRNALVKVVAWFNQHGWTYGACAYATSSGNLAFFVNAEFFYSVFECLEHFESAKRDTAAGATNIYAVLVSSFELKLLLSYSLKVIKFQI